MVSLTVNVVLQGAENDSKYRDVAPLISSDVLFNGNLSDINATLSRYLN